MSDDSPVNSNKRFCFNRGFIRGAKGCSSGTVPGGNEADESVCFSRLGSVKKMILCPSLWPLTWLKGTLRTDSGCRLTSKSCRDMGLVPEHNHGRCARSSFGIGRRDPQPVDPLDTFRACWWLSLCARIHRAAPMSLPSRNVSKLRTMLSSCHSE